MKGTLKTLATLVVFSASAAFAANIENPLYAPSQYEFYSKTGFGLMYKKVDHTNANVKAGNAGKVEYPLRFYEDLGFGISSNLSVNAAFGYTDNDKRSGMHLGRIGLDLRMLDGSEKSAGFVWDIYAHGHLGGVSEMSGSYSLSKGFKYDNYTNGRWGYYVGTKIGSTWDKLTVAAFGEALQTMGNDNNKIDLKPAKAEAGLMVQPYSAFVSICQSNPEINNMCPDLLMAAGLTTLPDEASINLKSTLEFNAGLKSLYQINDLLSVGGHFTFKNHADNGVESVATKPRSDIEKRTMETMAAQLKNMDDGFNEYIFGLSVGAQLIPNLQTVLFFERTLDTANEGCQNGTHNKAEAGLRVNLRF
jgi:hypothetical protein